MYLKLNDSYELEFEWGAITGQAIGIDGDAVLILKRDGQCVVIRSEKILACRKLVEQL